jgi:IPT/TIG domain
VQTPDPRPSTTPAVLAPAVVPTITGISPPSGPTAGGTTVTLTGTAFPGANSVRFGTTPASFTITSATTISAVSPPGTGSVQVTVTTPGGNSNGITYTYQNVPTISALSPDAGPTVGGNTVTITGTNLSGVTSVTFGGTPAVSFVVVSPTEVTAIAPSGAAGLSSVTVTAGTTSSAPAVYFYVAAPVVTAIAPTAGPATGGTTVTLTGANLVEATAVAFGGTPAASFTVVSSTEVQAVTPPGAGTVEVTVTTAGGTDDGVFFQYLAAPVITSVAPAAGPTSGGQTVTVTGSGLAFTSGVTFDGVAAPFTVFSDTPAGSASIGYERVPAPAI